MNRRGNQEHYTPEEDAAIIAQWPRAPLRHLAGVIDRSAASIERRARILVNSGLLDRAQRFYHRPWSEAADDLIRDHYGRVPDATLAANCGRTVNAVRERADRLGVRKDDAALSGQDVARILGIDSHAVRPLIERGLLAAKRAPYERGCKRVWLIEVEDVERFLKRHPEHYDYRRVVEEPWLSIARAAYKADPVLTPAEAARLLGVTKETIIRHCGRGWLAATAVPSSGKYGREWRIRRSSLAAFRPRNLGGAWRASLGGSIAQQNGQRKQKAKPRRPLLRFRTRESDREKPARGAAFRPVDWRTQHDQRLPHPPARQTGGTQRAGAADAARRAARGAGQPVRPARTQSAAAAGRARPVPAAGGTRACVSASAAGGSDGDGDVPAVWLGARVSVIERGECVGDARGAVGVMQRAEGGVRAATPRRPRHRAACGCG